MNSALENSSLTAEAETLGIRSQGLQHTAIWGGTIFLSAFLLFQVQPVLAKIERGRNGVAAPHQISVTASLFLMDVAARFTLKS